MRPLSPAEIAWYVTGRFYRGEDGLLADYGYFLHLPFADCPLFDGPPGEATACFTFAAVPSSGAASHSGEKVHRQIALRCQVKPRCMRPVRDCTSAG